MSNENQQPKIVTNMGDVAQHFDVSLRQVSLWKAAGMPVGEIGYDLEAIAAWKAKRDAVEEQELRNAEAAAATDGALAENGPFKGLPLDGEGRPLANLAGRKIVYPEPGQPMRQGSRQCPYCGCLLYTHATRQLHTEMRCPRDDCPGTGGRYREFASRPRAQQIPPPDDFSAR